MQGNNRSTTPVKVKQVVVVNVPGTPDRQKTKPVVPNAPSRPVMRPGTPVVREHIRRLEFQEPLEIQ